MNAAWTASSAVGIAYQKNRPKGQSLTDRRQPEEEAPPPAPSASPQQQQIRQHVGLASINLKLIMEFPNRLPPNPGSQ